MVESPDIYVNYMPYHTEIGVNVFCNIHNTNQSVKWYVN